MVRKSALKTVRLEVHMLLSSDIYLHLLHARGLGFGRGESLSIYTERRALEIAYERIKGVF